MDPSNTSSGLPTASQSAFPQGLEKEVFNTGASVAEILAIPPNITIRYTMPGINQHARTITSLEDALAYTHRVKASANPAVNDDPGVVRLKFSHYRKRIFNAIIILPHDADDTQESQWDAFALALNGGRFDLRDIEAKSWIVMEEIIKLHEQGTNLPAKYDKSLKSAADRGMKCSQRMETIINCLLYSKTVCLDVMVSNLAMLRFVAAPNAVMKGKKQDKDGNLGVNQTLAAIQANVGSAPAPPQFHFPNVAPATIGPQPQTGSGQTGPPMPHPRQSPASSNAPPPSHTSKRVPTTDNFDFVPGLRPAYRSGRVGSFTNPYRKLDVTETSSSNPTLHPATEGITGGIPPASANTTPSRPQKRARVEDEEAETEPNDQGEGDGQQGQDGQGGS